MKTQFPNRRIRLALVLAGAMTFCANEKDLDPDLGTDVHKPAIQGFKPWANSG